ncbi:DUF6703 family protein [Thermomonospora cellulosilytica]|uniref:Energy-coupling factor transporter transmembrane protein EcfT n=1 Tax=Thermomonospora cellulosilytica TaxID=1411118 RepID=A0A7W3N3K4_9ACTN|nr:DUF6703 family protein [Thermomonospora cellulosilytica]MBA9006880.1 energy-coupling factor transporter transmembrane protein EcfT [Thermomonospora cellulosilytica]
MSTRPDPHAPGLRGAIERRSAVPVVFLHRLPVWVPLLAVFALLAVGMAGTGWVAAAALGVLALLLAWFAYLNWPALRIGGRTLRVAAITVLVVSAAGRLLG